MQNNTITSYLKLLKEKIIREYIEQIEMAIPGVVITTESEFSLIPESEKHGYYDVDIFNIPSCKMQLAEKIERNIRRKLKKNFRINVSIILHNSENTEKYYCDIIHHVLEQRKSNNKRELHKFMPFNEISIKNRYKRKKEFALPGCKIHFGSYQNEKSLVMCNYEVKTQL